MNKIRMKVLMTAVAGGLLFPSSIIGQNSPYSPQILPPAPKAKSIQITQGPELELARDKFAIITWTTNNPGGTDVHFGVVHYGTSPNDLSQTARSPIHLNRYHPDTVFRVRVAGLAPQTTYYYTVESTEATGPNDGVKSDVKHFSTQ